MRRLETIGMPLLLVSLTAPAVRAESSAEELANQLRQSPRVETLVPLLPRFSALLQDDAAAIESLSVIEQAAEILGPGVAEHGQEIAAASLLRFAARARLEQGETDKAIKLLQSLSEIRRRLGERLPPATASRQRARWTRELALEYLRMGETQRALDQLNEAFHPEEPASSEIDETLPAVAGALYRRLEPLSTDERFELLYAWTIPSDGPRRVQVLSSATSVESPPDVFARVLGERPRTQAFPVPRIGGVDGMFSTGWLLVRAAAESGRLRRLTGELAELAQGGVPHSEFLLLLARIADGATDAEQVRGVVEKRLALLAVPPPTPRPAGAAGNPPQGTDPGDWLQWLVTGAACLERAELRPTGQRIMETLLERRGDSALASARPFLQRARAIAILRQHEGADPQLLSDPGLRYWIPASEEIAVRSAAGAVPETWLMHEDHVVHLAGPHNDFLCFRYPLSGDFEFQVEAQNGGPDPTGGGLAFGGLAYGVAGETARFHVWGLGRESVLTRPFPFVRRESWPTYQQLTLRSGEQGIQHVVNGHPVWTDPVRNSTSPWLAIRCLGDGVPAFRNFKLAGNPVVPRDVRMSDGDLLRGWFTRFYPSKVSPALMPAEREISSIRVPHPAKKDPDNPDWFARDGVIHGLQHAELFREAAPSRLTYFRPLQSGESVHYEFWYEPGVHEVHPGVGRLVFLLEPQGVRVRWMTSGPSDWSGLPENNATVEPLYRRGPRPLPLKAGTWNGVSMALNNDVLSLTLNGIEVYARKMEPENSRRFSLYHDRNRSAAQVRNVVMRGDWPERLPEDALKDLLVRQ